MTGLKYKNAVLIPDIIVPQSTAIYDKYVYIFDKINTDEGRLYKYNPTSGVKELLLELDEGECFFGRDGNIYMLNSKDDDSSIEVYDTDGNLIKSITLKGTTYYIDIDTEGIIYGVFSQTDGMIVNVYSNDGLFLRSIHSRNMPFLSTLYSEDGHIYAGGFSVGIPLRVEKINYLSYIEDIYDLNLKNTKTIVSKILKFENTLIVLLTYGIEDSIVLVDMSSGQKQILRVPEIESINDICVSGDTLIVISSDRKIITYELAHESICTDIPKNQKERLFKSKSYEYVLCLIYIKNFINDFLSLSVRVALPVTMILSFFIWVNKGEYKNNTGTAGKLYFFIVLAVIISILCIVVKDISIAWRRKPRIDNTLDVYNRIEIIHHKALLNSAISSIIISLPICSALYNTGFHGILLSVVTIAVNALIFSIIYGLSTYCIKRFENDMENMVFELLSLETKDYEIFKKVKHQIKEIKKTGIECYRIKIFAEDKSKKRTIKLINRWVASRKKITGDDGSVKGCTEYLIFDLNLEKRDIKYSRLSVIEDFICYIYNNLNPSSIIIENISETEKDK